MYTFSAEEQHKIQSGEILYLQLTFDLTKNNEEMAKCFEGYEYDKQSNNLFKKWAEKKSVNI